MTDAAIKVRDLTKVYALAEHGGGPVSLWSALRAGQQEIGISEVRALDGVSFEVA